MPWKVGCGQVGRLQVADVDLREGRGRRQQADALEDQVRRRVRRPAPGVDVGRVAADRPVEAEQRGRQHLLAAVLGVPVRPEPRPPGGDRAVVAAVEARAARPAPTGTSGTVSTACDPGSLRIAASASPALWAKPKFGLLTWSHSNPWPNSCQATRLQVAMPTGWPGIIRPKSSLPRPVARRVAGRLRVDRVAERAVVDRHRERRAVEVRGDGEAEVLHRPEEPVAVVVGVQRGEVVGADVEHEVRRRAGADGRRVRPADRCPARRTKVPDSGCGVAGPRPARVCDVRNGFSTALVDAAVTAAPVWVCGSRSKTRPVAHGDERRAGTARRRCSARRAPASGPTAASAASAASNNTSSTM